MASVQTFRPGQKALVVLVSTARTVVVWCAIADGLGGRSSFFIVVVRHEPADAPVFAKCIVASFQFGFAMPPSKTCGNTK